MTDRDSGFGALFRFVSQRTGLRFDEHRRPSAESIIQKCMQRAHCTDADRYRRHLIEARESFDDLVAELTVGETYFFRDLNQFTFIQSKLLPELLRRKRDGQAFRFWSAGCASGEEPYSVAIVLHRAGLLGRSRLLATDISYQALSRARDARYRKWSLRGPDSNPAREYMRHENDQFILDERIRQSVEYEYLNLALDSYPSPANGTNGLDLILCRNVLIYFDDDTIRRVADRLYECLNPGGCLMLGASDPSVAGMAPFETVIEHCGAVYRRSRQTKPVPIAYMPPIANTVEAHPANKSTDEAPRLEQTAATAAHSPATVNERRRQTEIRAATEALARGDYDRVVELAAQYRDDPAACALEIRAASKTDSAEAERLCAQTLSKHSVSAELRYLHAVLLLKLNRDQEAVEAARGAVFLDRSLAIGHFTLGAALARIGDEAGARRAYRNTIQICGQLPDDAVVPLSEDERATRLAASARRELTLLDSVE